MNVPPLSPTQLAALTDLQRRQRIDTVPSDPLRAANFLTQAKQTLEDLRNLKRPGTRYTLAYDAAHDVGEALLAAYGYRTTNGPGQHETIGTILKIILDTPPGSAAASRFDRLRRARNRSRYEARPIGEANAQLAIQTAHDLIQAIDHWEIAS